jgi:hypothetical protein
VKKGHAINGFCILNILQTELYLGEKIIKNYETMRNLPLDFSSRGKYMQTKKVKRGNIMTNTHRKQLANGAGQGVK